MMNDPMMNPAAGNMAATGMGMPGLPSVAGWIPTNPILQLVMLGLAAYGAYHLARKVI